VASNIFLSIPTVYYTSHPYVKPPIAYFSFYHPKDHIEIMKATLTTNQNVPASTEGKE
jgi:hypothetical protein